ncbi:MAG: tripartite tricarboxylate transporter TctB family protein [Proteobacteria bacterium]|nr:tripartite tricarboxylate transporter TctB family protein [Pseudomonadota bacterium]
MSGGRIKSPEDFCGAIFLLLICALALWQASELTFGTLRAVGPGLMPTALAVLLAGLACVLMVSSLKDDGPDVSPPSWRGILFVLGAFVAFGLAVRPLGLAVAGPLAVIIAGFASDETRPGETVLFGLGMTAFCIALFKFALGLPIPLAPWLLGY